MNSDRLRCAEAALRTVPEDYVAVTPDAVALVDNGHSFHRGMHIGWAWAEDRRGWFLDFLSEHRMAGMSAERFHADGTSERLETPASMYQVTGDPARDAEAERRLYQQNRAAYEWLRARGLLPPQGANVGSQDINEVLLKGGVVEPDS
ncbi:hypothetical protein [Nocardioides sp. KR10-350]|uniref:hypothetical protein n=1 Tax=Nocardioides cheoyonin TaxID=3156615 RepID=UPI0032B59309